MTNPFFDILPEDAKKEMLERCDRIRALEKYQKKIIELKPTNKKFIEWSTK